jgi:hypothetical protein
VGVGNKSPPGGSDQGKLFPDGGGLGTVSRPGAAILGVSSHAERPACSQSETLRAFALRVVADRVGSGAVGHDPTVLARLLERKALTERRGRRRDL